MRDNEANLCFIQYITNDIERNRCPSHESFISLTTTKKTTPMHHFGSQHSYQSLVAIFFYFCFIIIIAGNFRNGQNDKHQIYTLKHGIQRDIRTAFTSADKTIEKILYFFQRIKESRKGREISVRLHQNNNCKQILNVNTS